MSRNEDERRFFGGPRPLGALIPALTRQAFKRKSPAAAQIMADWPALVGPALAAVTQPLRLTAGSLTIACSGPIALELSHLAPELVARINGGLGRVAVERLRFVQTQPPAAKGAKPALPPRPVALPARVAANLESLPTGDLRAALERLARGVYRKQG
ncbi:MAG: DUF721 domain-containing protein [Roseomonas sp.]|nr:DUF721 domain-containing protein [Roseomonas sp.]